MLFIVSLLPFLALISATNSSDPVVRVVQMKLSKTGTCLHFGTIDENSNAGLSAIMLQTCEKAFHWKVYESGRLEHLYDGGLSTIGEVVNAAFPDHIVRPSVGETVVAETKWNISDGNRISVISDQTPKYCLSKVTASEQPSLYLRTVECNTTPVEKEGDTNQVWEIKDFPVPAQHERR